ncbi:DUF5693 family protein [Paenibacillus koleovorans]|uniref:DUF5693 family protein n=1 Tax=Paenibacillus koleovorans TaxID=121608 RepID=UPI000FDC7831|nr:DUF5693 family protein [Paenibacillus koleovorans]
MERYLQWNRQVSKWLWLVVIVGLVASLPLGIKRIQTERSTKNVELVFDYRDLLEASQYKPNPADYLNQQLTRLKNVGVGTMSVYEASLEELKYSRSIQVFTQNEYSAMTGKPIVPNENFTYLLFTSNAAREKLQPLIENVYRKRLNVEVRSWSYNNQNGLIITLPYEEANTKPLPPDPITLDKLHNQLGFQILARLSNRLQPFSAEEFESTLKTLSDYGVKRIVFDGVAVTGYDEEPEDSHVKEVAHLMVKYGMGTGAIERLKAPQRGFTVQFVDRLQGNAVRVFPLFDTEVNLKPDVIADKLVLAVKDRDIRLLFINTKSAKDTEKGFMNDYMDNIIESLEGPKGAVERIEGFGYKLGEAHAFVEYGKAIAWLKVFVLIGAVALIAITVGYFFPLLVTLLFAVGVVGVLGLYGLSASIALQAAAFGAAVCAPTWATLHAIRSIQAKAATNPRIGTAIVVFLRTTVMTFVGIAYVVALLSGLSYYLVLEQFRGVALLHLLPIVFVGLYVLLFNGETGIRGVVKRARTLLAMKISILWIVLAGVVLGGLWYYLSRTGNEGQASNVEKMFRALLEEKMGVRPRTKEFLFAHPLFIVGAYLLMRYRFAAFAFIGAVMGQLSLVDTFAHLHTPIYISALRVMYGVIVGIVVGLAAIGIWNLLARSWKRWSPSLLKE